MSEQFGVGMNVRASIYSAVMAAIVSGALCAPVAASLIVPAHSSLPGAPTTVYLNFLGDHTDSFSVWSNFDTPVYSTDSDFLNFTVQEQTNIDHIWSGVAEKFSPFNLNVTTVDPLTRNDQHTVVIDIGGNGSWTGGLSGGISNVNGLLSGISTGYVFSANLANGLPKYTTEASAHETGHILGLIHQSSYDMVARVRTEQYNSNGSSTVNAPILGTSYAALRGQWWYGPTETSLSIYQDDMAKISQTGNFTNNIGYRPDDHPNTYVAADNATVASELAITAQGIIEKSSDVDVFKFVTPGGVARIFADPNPDNPMLDLSLKIMDSDGNVLQTSEHPATSSALTLRETVYLRLDPGTYELMISPATINVGTSIANTGGYDVGQYFITGEVAPEPSILGSLFLGVLALGRRRGVKLSRLSPTV